MDACDWSYPRLAGFIDSDGSISLQLINKKNLRQRFGGSVSVNQGPGRNGYVWKLRGERATTLLANISPHLIHRQDRAHFLLQHKGQYDNIAFKHMFALNSQNSSVTRMRFEKRF